MKTKKFYYIDISECNEAVKELFEGLTLIPVVESVFCCDFDLLEDELPAHLCNKFRYETKAAKQHIKNLSYWLEAEELLKDSDYLPIGIYKSNMPDGAVVIDR